MRFFLCIITLGISLSLLATQDSLSFFKGRNWYVSVQQANGFLVSHGTPLEALSKDYTHSFFLEVGSKTFGKKAWQANYNYPSLGLGFFRSSLSNDEVFGRANALYGFIEVPYFIEKKATITYQVGFGLSYMATPFDLHNNIYNRAIGSHVNAFIRLSYDLKVNLLDNKAFIKTGVGFTHMSNSKIKTPNKGLNILDLHLTLAYNLTPRQRTIKSTPVTRDRHTFIGIASGGVKEFTAPLRGKYPAGNITFEYEYATWSKSAWGAGLDLFYDGVVKERLIQRNDPKPFIHANRFGAHVSYIHYYGKIGYITQVGYYINPYFTSDLPYYFRIGLRAKVSKHLLINLSMKTHLAKADILEFGVGYYFSRK